jgi:hypothetical protein
MLRSWTLVPNVLLLVLFVFCLILSPLNLPINPGQMYRYRPFVVVLVPFATAMLSQNGEGSSCPHPDSVPADFFHSTIDRAYGETSFVISSTAHWTSFSDVRKLVMQARRTGGPPARRTSAIQAI